MNSNKTHCSGVRCASKRREGSAVQVRQAENLQHYAYTPTFVSGRKERTTALEMVTDMFIGILPVRSNFFMRVTNIVGVHNMFGLPENLDHFLAIHRL